MGSLSSVDVAVIAIYVVFALGIGSLFFKEAGKGLTSFFVGDRKLPWWIAGTSIVATTFAADTPLAVAGIVADDGISGNWIWWAWAIAHLSATFFFARLWRRSGVITDAEITEVRYKGRAAAALRGVKAVYFGIFINCLTMAWVILAMVKISGAFFPDVEPWKVIALCIGVSVAYTSLGGFRGVVITDLVQFALGMLGAIILAWYAVDAFGGIGHVAGDAPGEGLLGQLEAVTKAAGRDVQHVLEFVPGLDHPSLPPLYFAVLLFAGWWRYAEGNGYLVQRLAACKDEGHAQGASLWFSVAHNALRPWPWILVGLAGLVVYPKVAPPSDNLRVEVTLPTGPATLEVTPAKLDLVKGGELVVKGAPVGCEAGLAGARVPLTGERGGEQTAHFDAMEASGLFDLLLYCPAEGVTVQAAPPTTIGPVAVSLLDREMAYPLMMKRELPSGLLGLVIASLLAAFMSTIDTHTNWGASYLVNDVYRRFLVKDAPEHHYAWVSRGSIVLMALIAGVAASFITSIAGVWRFLIALGAGLGSVTAARWYWSRVTPQAEFAAMGVTTVLAVGLEVFASEKLFGSDNALFLVAIPAWAKILLIAGASLATWIPVALFGPKNDEEQLDRFYAQVQPPGPGWADVAARIGHASGVGSRHALLSFGCGLVIVFGTLFGIGEVLIGSLGLGLVELGVAAGLLALVIRLGRGKPVAAPSSDPS